MYDSAIPFGLLFAENEIALAGEVLAVYDEDQDVWVVEENGERVPLVSVADPRMSTETVTEVAGEHTDALEQDAEPLWRLSTDPETKAQEDYTVDALRATVAEPLATDTETRIPGDDR